MAKPKVRLNVELSLEAEEMIAKMASDAHTSKSGVVKRAITLMKTVMDAQQAGKQIVIGDKDGTQTVLMT